MTATVLHEAYMTQYHSFTLITFYAIVLSFALMFTDGWFTCMRWLLCCFYLLAESYETINH